MVVAAMRVTVVVAAVRVTVADVGPIICFSCTCVELWKHYFQISIISALAMSGGHQN